MHNQFFPPPSTAKAPFQILIVDDSQLNRRVLMGYIRTHLNEEHIPHHINTAANGELAVHAVEAMLKEKNRNYELIILDNQMPIMKGEEAAIHIRALEEAHGISDDKKTYLVTWSDNRAAPFEGSNVQIEKPINKAELEKMLDHVLLPKPTPPLNPRSSGQ